MVNNSNFTTSRKSVITYQKLEITISLYRIYFEDLNFEHMVRNKFTFIWKYGKSTRTVTRRPSLGWKNWRILISWVKLIRFYLTSGFYILWPRVWYFYFSECLNIPNFRTKRFVQNIVLIEFFPNYGRSSFQIALSFILATATANFSHLHVFPTTQRHSKVSLAPAFQLLWYSWNPLTIASWEQFSRIIISIRTNFSSRNINYCF